MAWNTCLQPAVEAFGPSRRGCTGDAALRQCQQIRGGLRVQSGAFPQQRRPAASKKQPSSHRCHWCRRLRRHRATVTNREQNPVLCLYRDTPSRHPGARRRHGLYRHLIGATGTTVGEVVFNTRCPATRKSSPTPATASRS